MNLLFTKCSFLITDAACCDIFESYLPGAFNQLFMPVNQPQDECTQIRHGFDGLAA